MAGHDGVEVGWPMESIVPGQIRGKPSAMKGRKP
jgi:hypothetical protein